MPDHKPITLTRSYNKSVCFYGRGVPEHGSLPTELNSAFITAAVSLLSIELPFFPILFLCTSIFTDVYRRFRVVYTVENDPAGVDYLHRFFFRFYSYEGYWLSYSIYYDVTKSNYFSFFFPQTFEII